MAASEITTTKTAKAMSFALTEKPSSGGIPSTASSSGLAKQTGEECSPIYIGHLIIIGCAGGRRSVEDKVQRNDEEMRSTSLSVVPGVGKSKSPFPAWLLFDKREARA